MPESLQLQDRTSRSDFLRIRAVAERTILHLKTWASGLAQTCPKVRIAGLDLPQEVGAIRAGELRALCTGPSNWLLVAPGPLSLPARRAIEADSARQGLALVDLSSGLSVLEVSGPATRDVLAKSCGLDFDPFPAGHCARTRFAQIPVVIDCVQGSSRFELYTAQSYAHYLKGWLSDAVQDVNVP